jgi:hypothetical protein
MSKVSGCSENGEGGGGDVRGGKLIDWVFISLAGMVARESSNSRGYSFLRRQTGVYTHHHLSTVAR